MKRYLLHSILIGLVCMNFISTPVQGIEINRIKHAINAPREFFSNNVYPLACIGAACFIGGYLARTLFNYWKDREKVYEIDGITKVVINKWPYAGPQEYIAVIMNSKTNQEYGSLIYHVQPLNVVYIRRFVIDPNFRKQQLGSKLLQTVLDKLPSLYGCKKVTLQARPFELREGETKQQMLPKLIKFYEKHGAKVVRIEGDSTWMAINLVEQA